MRVGKFLAVALLDLALGTAYAQTNTKVMVMEIRSEIDPRMRRYVELALGHAEKTKADYVIVDMDTYGGVLTDAKEIVDLIMGFKKPIWVFINSDAASAARSGAWAVAEPARKTGSVNSSWFSPLSAHASTPRSRRSRANSAANPCNVSTRWGCTRST